MRLGVQVTGARINIPIDVRQTGRYEVLSRIAQAPDYGDYIALVGLTRVDCRRPASGRIAIRKLGIRIPISRPTLSPADGFRVRIGDKAGVVGVLCGALSCVVEN